MERCVRAESRGLQLQLAAESFAGIAREAERRFQCPRLASILHAVADLAVPAEIEAEPRRQGLSMLPSRRQEFLAASLSLVQRYSLE